MRVEQAGNALRRVEHLPGAEATGLAAVLAAGHPLPAAVLLTARPAFVPSWTPRSHLTQLALTRFAHRQTAAMLADPDKAWKSWEQYLTTTDLYRARLHRWQKEKMIWGVHVVKQEVAAFFKSAGRTNRAAARTPAPNKPDPGEVAADLTLQLLDCALIDTRTDDHLMVCLSLPSPPAHTNGKWDETRKQVAWESDLEDRTNSVRLPLFCYASWSEPNEPLQNEYFGRVVLRGDDLTKYCLWRHSLNPRQAREWDGFLTGLRSVEAWKARLEAFRFSDEPVAQTNRQTSSLADLPRELIGSGSD